MDPFELKREQLKLAPKILLNDAISKIKTIGGAACFPFENKLYACVVVCEYPSLKLLEKQTFILTNPLPYKPGFMAYREMPAIIEAYNKLEQEPDILIVSGHGVAHPRKIGLASHLGLALNVPTIGIGNKLLVGKVEQGKIHLRNEIVGFEVKTREYANSLYVSPGHLITLGSTLNFVKETIKFPHKLPEPLHLAKKIAKKEAKVEM
ncbi:MAG: endonuclease V [Nanoarchaeota archaeon]|nr:endonuclease V [Nanoarchaeota archaeon]MBU1622769.1 endonuclease V [Nanoarchaeota archaeon]